MKMDKEIAIIAALSDNNVIAKDGKLPWHIPEDMRRFRDLTMPHPVIMGRKTYESLPEKFRPLPQRTNIVVTKKRDYNQNGIIISHSLQEALEKAGNLDNLSFIIGGGEIYEQSFRYTTKIHLTRVHTTVEGGNLTYFPTINWEEWTEINRQDKEGYSFIEYKRNHWSC